MKLRIFVAAGLATTLLIPVSAQQPPAGDKDDQLVVTGCVMRSGENNTSGPRSLLVWSRGDFYLESASTQTRPSETGRPVGTAGRGEVVFYWIDDENDLAKFAGQRVEIVGELSSRLQKGEFEIEHKDPFTEIEFEVNGREAKVQVPSSWLGPGTAAKDSEFDILVRTVDVEKVTPLGACGSR